MYGQKQGAEGNPERVFEAHQDEHEDRHQEPEAERIKVKAAHDPH